MKQALAFLMAIFVSGLLLISPVIGATGSIVADSDDGRTYRLISPNAGLWEFGDGGTAIGKEVEHTFCSGRWTVMCYTSTGAYSSEIDVYDDSPILEAYTGQEYRFRSHDLKDLVAVQIINGGNGSWLQYDSATKAIVGTPEDVGEYTVFYKTTTNVIKSFPLTVMEGQIQDSLTIESYAVGYTIKATASMDLTNKLCDWQVYDTSGTQIGSGWNDPQLEIDVHSAGTYLVVLTVSLGSVSLTASDFVTVTGSGEGGHGGGEHDGEDQDEDDEDEEEDDSPSPPDWRIIAGVAVGATLVYLLWRRA